MLFFAWFLNSSGDSRRKEGNFCENKNLQKIITIFAKRSALF